MSDPVLEVLGRTALVSVSATLVALAIGIPLGTALALARLPGRRLVVAVVNTGMAVPTVVVGLVVALLLWRSGPLGDLELIYTLRGMVVAQVLIAAPLVTGITLAALQLLPADLPDQLRALGATRTQLVVRLWLEARLPLLAAAMAGFRHRRGGHEVLRVEHLAVEPGERLAVLGPNGAGKTTLLRLLAGVERATSGSVLLDGTPTCTLDVGQRRRIGYVTQRPGLLSATVRRNVELPLAWRRVGRAERRRRAEEALALLGVAHLADRRAVRLSGGEQQRVSLARSLMLEPALLLLDEPAAGLDAPSRSAFLADLATALGGGPTTVVHVSHRPAEALRGADVSSSWSTVACARWALPWRSSAARRTPPSPRWSATTTSSTPVSTPAATYG